MSRDAESGVRLGSSVLVFNPHALSGEEANVKLELEPLEGWLSAAFAPGRELASLERGPGASSAPHWAPGCVPWASIVGWTVAGGLAMPHRRWGGTPLQWSLMWCATHELLMNHKYILCVCKLKHSKPYYLMVVSSSVSDSTRISE